VLQRITQSDALQFGAALEGSFSNEFNVCQGSTNSILSNSLQSVKAWFPMCFTKSPEIAFKLLQPSKAPSPIFSTDVRDTFFAADQRGALRKSLCPNGLHQLREGDALQVGAVKKRYSPQCASRTYPI